MLGGGMLFAFSGLHPGIERLALSRQRQPTAARSLFGGMIFGSIARGQWHERSDLDVRLLRRPGVWNGVTGVLIVLRERWIALWSRQPLDIYLADGIPFLKRMRADEPPVFLKRDDPRLELAYPDGKETRIEVLRRS
jgi:hypothetical protein